MKGMIISISTHPMLSFN